MKNTCLILAGFLFILTSCNQLTIDSRKSYVESEPSFFELRNGDWLTNKWIRSPNNLLTIHETFKKVCYNELNVFKNNKDSAVILFLFTLKTLLEIEYRNDTLTPELALKDFTTLKELGFHQSAYNLLY